VEALGPPTQHSFTQGHGPLGSKVSLAIPGGTALIPLLV